MVQYQKKNINSLQTTVMIIDVWSKDNYMFSSQNLINFDIQKNLIYLNKLWIIIKNRYRIFIINNFIRYSQIIHVTVFVFKILHWKFLTHFVISSLYCHPSTATSYPRFILITRPGITSVVINVAGCIPSIQYRVRQN